MAADHPALRILEPDERIDIEASAGVSLTIG